MSSQGSALCEHGWEALRADPLTSLLDHPDANFRWRALHELVGRPVSSPAVRRAMGGANVAPPLADLLAPLAPDGRWSAELPRWRPYTGSVWRLVAAASLGADPADPRLRASAEGLLAELSDGESFTADAPSPPAPCVVARVLEGLAQLGQASDHRFQEGLAWLEEQAEEVGPGGGWACAYRAHHVGGDGCVVAAVATTAALLHSGDQRRHRLRQRAHGVVHNVLAAAADSPALRRWGYPNLLRTDLVEMLNLLARARSPYDSTMRRALLVVQSSQDEGAWWRRRHPAPALLQGAPSADRGVSRRSAWITLRATVALLHYAVPAALPRRFPAKPDFAQE